MLSFCKNRGEKDDVRVRMLGRICTHSCKQPAVAPKKKSNVVVLQLPPAGAAAAVSRGAI
jgi:hypothetical protein